jgi:hypothetical protein
MIRQRPEPELGIEKAAELEEGRLRAQPRPFSDQDTPKRAGANNHDVAIAKLREGLSGHIVASRKRVSLRSAHDGFGNQSRRRRETDDVSGFTRDEVERVLTLCSPSQ